MRLKGFADETDQSGDEGFNSIKVRLKEMSQAQKVDAEKFQFHKGAIKRKLLESPPPK